jgi:HEAT repeat protein
MKVSRWIVPAVLLLCMPVFAADGDLPLDVYQKFKAHFDLLYGAGNSLLSGAPVRSKEEVEKDLRADAAAQKDVLIRGLKAEKPVQRELATMALEYCGDKKAAVAALIPVVSDSDASVRRAATAVLARLPDAAAVDALIKGLADDVDNVRGISATALGNIKDNRAIEPLLAILKDDSKPMVRLQAALALAKIRDASALKSLKAALDNEKDERVKMAIAGALRATMGADDAATSAVPNSGDAANELASLAHEMKEVEAKLREDRFDQAVQVQGKGIEDKLAALILKLDKG